MAGVTPAAIEAYRRRDWHTLHMLCGLKPWHELMGDVTGPEPPPYCDKACWAEVWVLRQALEAAAKARNSEEIASQTR